MSIAFLGWFLLAVRILLPPLIGILRRSYLREQANCKDDAALLEQLRLLVQAENKEDDARKSSSWRAAKSQLESRGSETIKGESLFRRGSLVVEPLWHSRWFQVIFSVLRVVRLLEAIYTAQLGMQTIFFTVLVLGAENFWYMLLILLLPLILISFFFSQLTMKDFSVLLSVCKPDGDTIHEVTSASRQLMRDYHALRTKFSDHFSTKYQGSSHEELVVKATQTYDSAKDTISETLSLDRFAALIEELVASNGDHLIISRTALRRVLRVIDTNQNGRISLREFVRFAVDGEVENRARMSSNRTLRSLVSVSLHPKSRRRRVDLSL